MKTSFLLARLTPKETETAIYCKIRYNGNRLPYFIGESIAPVYWENRKIKGRGYQRAKKSYENAPEFNRRLDQIEKDIKEIYLNYKTDNDHSEPDTTTFKALIDLKLQKSKGLKNEFCDYFQQIIEDSKKGIRLNKKKGTKISEATIKLYTHTLAHVKAFAKEAGITAITFRTVDANFERDFRGYLINTVALKPNSMGVYLAKVCMVMEEANAAGLHNNLAFKKFTIDREETDSIALTPEEIGGIEKLDLSDNLRLDLIRDLFVVSCYTGLRHSDYSTLFSGRNIHGDFLQKKQQKTDGRVAIPIHPGIERIITKYGGTLPEAIGNSQTNNDLKTIGKRAAENGVPSINAKLKITHIKGGKTIVEYCHVWELISTHTGRRSFATNEFNAGTPIIIIRSVTGHKTEEEFLKYIKMANRELADVLATQWADRAKQAKKVA
jgi:integrase-like protein/Arm domain-containing DNA-binding protein